MKLGFRDFFDIGSLKIPFWWNSALSREAIVKAKRPLLLKFARAMVEAIHFNKTNKEEAKAIWGKHLRISDPEGLERAYQAYTSAFPDRVIGIVVSGCPDLGETADLGLRETRELTWDDAMEIAKETNLTFVYKDNMVALTKAGIYRFDCAPARIKVFQGSAEVKTANNTVQLGSGKMLNLGSALAMASSRPRFVRSASPGRAGHPQTTSPATANTTTHRLNMSDLGVIMR